MISDFNLLVYHLADSVAVVKKTCDDIQHTFKKAHVYFSSGIHVASLGGICAEREHKMDPVIVVGVISNILSVVGVVITNK